MKATLVQIATLLLAIVVAFLIYVAIPDDHFNLVIENQTNDPISNFSLVYKNQYCGISTLQQGATLQCSLKKEGFGEFGILGRANDQPYLIENIEGIKLGSTFVNLILLKPDGTYEVNAKQKII